MQCKNLHKDKRAHGLTLQLRCKIWNPQASFVCCDKPLRDHVSGAECKDVDGCEAGLSAGWDKHHGGFGGRVLHDGVIYRLSHGQQASLSVAHIEALNRAERRLNNKSHP